MHPRRLFRVFLYIRCVRVLGGEALSSQQLELNEIEVLLKE